LEILAGSEEYIEPCIKIVTLLPTHFTDQAMISIKDDLKNEIFYVAIDDDKVVGFCCAKIKHKSVGEILWLAVVPNKQNHGIGTALIEYISNKFRQQEIGLLEVKTLADDSEYPPYELTRKFYKKMGFIHMKTIHPYPGWGPDNPCAIYVKKI
jgi:N-acetylglutamate synthase-like GNAT family acetyltransferase